MAIVGRVSQYASLNASGEFNEIGVSKVGVGTTGTFNSYEFNENVVDIVTSGLVLNLDAANTNSYPGIGITWTDVSGNGKNGTLINGTTYSSANSGSIVFDGVDDYVNCGAVNFTSGTSITVEVWVKPNSSQNALADILDYDHAPSAGGFVIQQNGASLNQYYFAYYNGSSYDITPTITLNSNSFNHLVFVKSGTSTIGYLNSVNTIQYTGISTIKCTGLSFSLGRFIQGAGREFKGNISNTKIYNRALTATEVLQNFNALKGRFENSPTTRLTLNTYPAYDPVSDEFGGTLYGPGKGTYVRQKSDQSLIVYNEINEFDLNPTVVFTPSATSLNESGVINFSIATTNVEDGVELYYEIITPSPTVILSQSVTSVKSGNSISFDATTVNVGNGTTLSYDIVGTAVSSDFTDNSLTGITTVTGGIIDTITKTTAGSGDKTFTLNLRSQGNILATSSSVTITPPSLYNFTSATFTPGGQTGLTGPTLAQAISGLTGTGVDAWKNNTAFFNTTNGVQLWTVPITGVYSIECFGAQGADDVRITVAGGLGAVVRGNFVLTKGDQYSIVVGQRGTTQTNGWGGGGGGGGTFVWKTGVTTQPVIVSGGGGCGGQNSTGSQAGQITTSGANGSNGGGTGGTGGSASQSQNICGGGGGRGWLGGPSYNCGGSFTYSATYIDATGHTTGQGGDGGFGGAGGSYGGGGGGGGYSGGGAGGWSSSGCGGGGGSYNTGTNQTNTPGVRSGPGQVTIALI
jgi:hypothetical protein